MYEGLKDLVFSDGVLLWMSIRPGHAFSRLCGITDGGFGSAGVWTYFEP
jgi:hypothetical protein